jgi:hypothetical protein
MGEVAAMWQVQAHDAVMRVQQRSVHLQKPKVQNKYAPELPSIT